MGAYSAIVQALQNRLVGHSADGGILDGASIISDPVKEVTGQDVLPQVRVFYVGFEEDASPGVVTRPVLDLVVIVSTVLSSGLPAHLGWVEAALDAIDTSDTGEPDPLFSGKLLRPMVPTAGEPEMVPESINTKIRLKAHLRETLRGGRRLTI
jgi:hypothetical protein